MIDRKAIASKILDVGRVAPKLEQKDEVVRFFENLFELPYYKTCLLLNKCIDKTGTMGEAKMLFCNKIYNPDHNFGLEETEVFVDNIKQLDFYYMNYDFYCVYETDDELIKLYDPLCEHYVVLSYNLTKMWRIVINIMEEIQNA